MISNYLGGFFKMNLVSHLWREHFKEHANSTSFGRYKE
jgi:hypothetical protein